MRVNIYLVYQSPANKRHGVFLHRKVLMISSSASHCSPTTQRSLSQLERASYLQHLYVMCRHVPRPISQAATPLEDLRGCLIILPPPPPLPPNDLYPLYNSTPTISGDNVTFNLSDRYSIIPHMSASCGESMGSCRYSIKSRRVL